MIELGLVLSLICLSTALGVALEALTAHRGQR